jgi:hypothetical protein
VIGYFEEKVGYFDGIQKLLVGMIMCLIRNATYEVKRAYLRKTLQMGGIEYKE